MSDTEKRWRFGDLAPIRLITGKIRNKVILILLGTSLGMVLIAGLALYAMELSRQTINEVIDIDGKILELSNDVKHHVLQARELDQKYFLNYRKLGFVNSKAEYADKFEAQISQAAEKLKGIVKLAGGEENSQAGKAIAQAVRTVTPYLEEYNQDFLEAVFLLEKRGNIDTGLEGKLLQAARGAEKILTEANAADMQLTLLSIRRHEKNYQIRGGRQYIANITELLGVMKQQVTASALPADSQQQLISLVDQYAADFDALVKADQQIANLSKFYRLAYNKTFPEIQTILDIEKAEQAANIAEIKEINDLTFKVVVGASAATIILALLGALVFSNRLTRQIDKIMEMFGSIGIGDFSARAEVVSNDELGEMAESMNAMLDNTLTLIQSRDERDAIQASIMRLLNEISDLADGDLTVRAEVTEEITGAIADSFNAMATQLSEVVKRVKQSAAEVSQSTSEVGQSTRDLAEYSDKQAEKIRAAVGTIKDLADAIQDISRNAGMTAEVSNKAKLSAQEGSLAVKKTNEAMTAIKDNMRGTARTIKRLGESSQEIGNITQIINDIADRTSILALNASIQAAMAGDAGRGFAVVAEEVQRLAERSAGSTKQIETLVSGIQNEITEAAASMERSIQYVVSGTELSDEAFSKLMEIENVSRQLAETINAISAAAEQKSQDSELIAEMMEEVGALTEKTTDATKNTVASMERITSTAHSLVESIATFKLEDEPAA
jgi:twitching motility protein PilJ